MQRNDRKTRIGVIVSDKMDKTVVVKVERQFKHPFYGKAVRRTKNFKVHDELNQYKTGSRVKIVETRPLSKDKRWRVLELISTGNE